MKIKQGGEEGEGGRRKWRKEFRQKSHKCGRTENRPQEADRDAGKIFQKGWREQDETKLRLLEFVLLLPALVYAVLHINNNTKTETRRKEDAHGGEEANCSSPGVHWGLNGRT